MNNAKVSIHHKISDTSKEIYEFEGCGNNWHYVGIYYSNRSGVDDVWGDEWEKFYEKSKVSELETIAKSFDYEDYHDMIDNNDFGDLAEKIGEIYEKYNPVCQKTTNGETYLYGTYWGEGSKTRKEYPPKISEEKIKEEILKQISKIKVHI